MISHQATTRAEQVYRTFRARVHDASELLGTVASPGKVSGTIRRVYGVEDAEQIGSDEILVAYGTDFDFMTALQNCLGVITVEGGILSHAAVISRELGKPCIVNVPQAMTCLVDGMRVKMGESPGLITVDTTYRSETALSTNIVELLSDDPHIRGNKARNIRKLARLGVRVLPGLVMDLDVQIKLIGQANELSAFILDKWRHQGSVIVRSNTDCEDSQAQSCAGLFESVVCHPYSRNLENALERVFTSYENPMLEESIRKVALDRPSVLVQPYYQQEFGGIAFSRHPVLGTCEMIVEFNTTARDVAEGNPSTIKSLPVDIEQELQETVDLIEVGFGCPVNVEWGWGDQGLVVFQSRPILAKADF